MRLLMLCVVCLSLYGETSASRHPENFTVTLCPDLHLCQNKGCGTSWIRNSACQCDWACEFFDDCCLDFASACSTESDDILDSLTKTQFECISQTASHRSGAREFWMVSHCPYVAEVSQTYAQIRKNCESTDDTNPLTLIPVTDASNITFRNIYCALCHGRSTSNLVAWRLKATCRNPILKKTSYAVFLRTVWNECSHFLELPGVKVSGPATRRPCIPSLISNCNQHNPQSLFPSCHNFTAVVKDADDGSLYRNPACFAACKGSQNYSSDCPTEASQTVNNQLFPEVIQADLLDSPTEASQTAALPGDVVPKPWPPVVAVNPPMLRPGVVPQSPLSVILIFNPTDGSQEQCPEGDLFDPFSQTCLSPQCEEGLEYVASEQRCEPVDDNTFRCLGDSNQGPGILLIIRTSHGNLTSNSFNTETGYKNKERCIRDLLDVNLTSVPTTYYPYSGKNSSQFAFNILVDGISEDDEKVKANEFETSISRQEAIDSVVVEIEKKLEESATTDASQCGIQSIQIVHYCGKKRNPYQGTLCSETKWLSLENETQVRVNNQTVWAFDDSHNAWYRLQEYNLLIQYNKHGSLFKKLRLEIGLCSEAPNNSCPAFVELSESQFAPVDEDTEDFENGSLIFLQTLEIIEPGEFTKTEDGQISICATKLPKNGTQFFNFNSAQNILSTVGMVISVAAGSVSLVTYLVFPSLHGRTRKAIMGMVTSLIAAQTLLLLSGIAAVNEKACMAAAVTGHFLWLASLTWTNVLAFLLWNTFASRNPSPSRGNVAVTGKINILSFSYALCIPLAIVIVCLIIHFCSCTDVVAMYDNHAPCWIQSGPINLVVFGAPMALFLVINIILFSKTVWAIRSSHRRAAAQFNEGRDTSFLKRRSKELFIYVRMASLMGFTWVFGFSAAFSGAEALWYLFIILNSLQGLFIFLSFTFSGQVKKLWMGRLMSIRGSVLNKTSLVANRSKSRATTSSISAGIAASDATNSSDYTLTSTVPSNDSYNEASSEASSRFKMALRRIKEKPTQCSEPAADNSRTKPSKAVKEDVPSSLPFPSDCHASSEYEEVIPGRCLQGGDDTKRFWHKLSLPRPKRTTPFSETAEHMTKIKGGATGSLAGPTIFSTSSGYDEVIPGRCLVEPKTDKKQDITTSSKSVKDPTMSNNSEFQPHGKETEKQAPKVPLLPFKIPGQSKTSVPQKNSKICLQPYQNEDGKITEQLPSRRPMLKKQPETESNGKISLDKPAIPPRVNMKTKEKDSNKTVPRTKPLLPPHPKPRLQVTQENAEGDHPKQEVTLNMSRSEMPVLPYVSFFLKGENSVSTPTGNPNQVDTSDDETYANMNVTQKTLPSTKQPLPPRPRVNAHKSRDESGWRNVIGQIKGQSMHKPN